VGIVIVLKQACCSTLPANLSQFVGLVLTKVPKQEKKLTVRWEEEEGEER
jgi:hypothetical protein